MANEKKKPNLDPEVVIFSTDVCGKKLYGFKNKDGKIVVKAIYSAVGDFSCGICEAVTESFRGPETIKVKHYIDVKGNVYSSELEKAEISKYLDLTKVIKKKAISDIRNNRKKADEIYEAFMAELANNFDSALYDIKIINDSEIIINKINKM